MGLEGFPEQILEETANDNEHAPFAPGERVTVRRTSGAIEDDWTFREMNSEGNAIVEKREGKDILTKEYPFEELKELNKNRTTGSEVERIPEAKEDDGGLSYEEVYGDGDMRSAFESLTNVLYPNGRTYERGSSESQVIFKEVASRLTSENDLMELVRKVAESEVSLTKELNDPNVSEPRKQTIKYQLASNRQRNEGFKKLRERLF
jgi:hypothetical protein